MPIRKLTAGLTSEFSLGLSISRVPSLIEAPLQGQAWRCISQKGRAEVVCAKQPKVAILAVVHDICGRRIDLNRTRIIAPDSAFDLLELKASQTWHLNLIVLGTSEVAMRQSQVVPRALLDATMIRYGNHQANTESHVCVVVYPEDFEIPEADKDFMKNLGGEVAKRIGDIELGIIHCKTNWYDNA